MCLELNPTNDSSKYYNRRLKGAFSTLSISKGDMHFILKPIHASGILISFIDGEAIS